MLAWDEGFPDKRAQLVSLRTEVLHQAFHWCQGYTYESAAVTPETALEVAVYEGAASVFAREHSEARPLWIKYEPLDDSVLRGWCEELRSMPAATYAATPELWRTWSGPQADPDQSWRSYRVGTWLVDQYLQRTGKSVIDLLDVPAKDVLKLLLIA